MAIQKINDNIYALILIGTSGSISLALSVIYLYVRYHKKFLIQSAEIQKAELNHRQHVLNAIMQSQENERIRISKDIHDHIGSSLSNLRFMVSRIQHLTPDIPAIQSITEEYKTMIDRVIEDVRNISHSLSPSGLALWGFQESLEEFCENMSLSTGLVIQVTDYSCGILKQLPFDISLSLFRVMQELLSNTIKHASAQKVSIITNKENNYIMIQYSDDGKGTDADVFHSHGIGMYNIESRLSMIQAEYTMKSSAGAGFSFNIKLPQNSLNKTMLYG